MPPSRPSRPGSRFPLLELIPAAPVAAAPHVGPDPAACRGCRNAALRSGPGRVGGWLAAASAASGNDGLSLLVPARFAAVVGELEALGPEGAGDLDADAWRAVWPRDLVKGAAFFGWPEPQLRRLTELVHHRVAAAAACRQISAAIADDAAKRHLLRTGGAAVPAWSLLHAVPLGRPIEHVRASAAVPRLFPGRTAYRTAFGTQRFREAGEVTAALVPALRAVLASSRHLVLAGGYAARVLFDRQVHDDAAYHGQDVDLFVWLPLGDDDEREARASAILADVIRILRAHYPLGRLFYSANAVTFHTGPSFDDEGDTPVSVFQVVLRLYSCPDEVLLGFDIAASSVALGLDEDGLVVVYATEGFKASVIAGAVWVDPERQSDSYAWRLVKYAKRGYEVLLFGVDEARLSCVPAGAELGGARGAVRGTERGLAELMKLARAHSGALMSPLSTLDDAFRHRARSHQHQQQQHPPSDYADALNFDALEHAPSMSIERTAGVVAHEDVQPVVWKTRAPGDQVTGSFHPRRTPFYVGAITAPYEGF